MHQDLLGVWVEPQASVPLHFAKRQAHLLMFSKVRREAGNQEVILKSLRRWYHDNSWPPRTFVNHNNKKPTPTWAVLESFASLGWVQTKEDDLVSVISHAAVVPLCNTGLQTRWIITNGMVSSGNCASKYNLIWRCETINHTKSGRTQKQQRTYLSILAHAFTDSRADAATESYFEAVPQEICSDAKT